ncbi:hypothetical protein [Mycobacterium sp. UM_CSW]|uniref:hypothetical protein n=1 Tax=Mycobacterium sp. UM_CSW TaxID=1370119 RepID=UPI00040C3D63|nr:hypothetical protein [Mycobacterium sp. UM_CSW]
MTVVGESRCGVDADDRQQARHLAVEDIIEAVGSPEAIGDQLLHALFTESATGRAAGG